MCGFLGHISDFEIDQSQLFSSNKFTECRGPDQLKHDKETLELKNNKKLFLEFIFNRLAIIDLSEKASQPMKNYLGNKILFNGEIFNHKELKKDLIAKGAKFYSQKSDTEVLLNGLSLDGISFIDKVIGQFSIAYLDMTNKKLHLIRDRLGQKPMFYFSSKHQFIFGSNLKSVSSLVSNLEISNDALIEYISNGVVSAPNTIFSNFYKLLPGEHLTINLNHNLNLYEKERYWKLENHVDNKPFSKEIFFELLDNSVKQRLESDVGLATLLSGGIDSTSISKIQRKLSKDINSFSISVSNSQYDESYWINLVNKKYDFNKKVIEIKPQIKKQEVLDSIRLFDEPYSDPSTFPSYKISKAISQNYKVAITGDGGDELLGGYTRIYNVLNRFKISSKIVDKLFAFYPPILGSGSNIKRFSNNLFSAYSSYYEDTKFLKILNVNNYKSILEDKFKTLNGNLYKSLILFDYKYYLPEMMLLKIDRTFMENSVEARSPFVDHRLVEYILSTDYKVDSKKSAKQILKNFLSEDFSEDFIYRKKMGFVFDIKKWVFSNEEFIKDKIDKCEYLEKFKIENYKKLFKFKTRINAIRIWKLFFLSIYLSSIENY